MQVTMRLPSSILKSFPSGARQTSLPGTSLPSLTCQNVEWFNRKSTCSVYIQPVKKKDRKQLPDKDAFSLFLTARIENAASLQNLSLQNLIMSIRIDTFGSRRASTASLDTVGLCIGLSIRQWKWIDWNHGNLLTGTYSMGDQQFEVIRNQFWLLECWATMSKDWMIFLTQQYHLCTPE